MSEENRRPANELERSVANEATPHRGPADGPEIAFGPETARSKLSVNVGHEISERLRSLAYQHRLSESSIVEVALTMFFARGDDAVLGAVLKELGATLRRK